jgi:electron transfer flavoprotein beta subunit
MNVAVCVKHAIDESELRADPSGRAQLQGAMAKMSTFDRNAVEEAVRIKESKGGTVTVVSLGAQDMKKTIKEALAMGCDKAIAVSIRSDLGVLETSYYLSRVLQTRGPFDIIILSEGASDTYHGIVGGMVAEWLKLPLLGYARKVTVADGKVRAELALDEHEEVVEAALPVVITVVSEINSARYPTLLQIMQASKKPIEEVTTDSIKDDRAPVGGFKADDAMLQSVSRKKIVFEGPPEEVSQKLLEALRKEGAI